MEPGHPPAPPQPRVNTTHKGHWVLSLLGSAPCCGSSFFCIKAKIIPTVNRSPHDRPADSAPLPRPHAAGLLAPPAKQVCLGLAALSRMFFTRQPHGLSITPLKSLLTCANLSETCAIHSKAVPLLHCCHLPIFPTTAKTTT